MLIRNNTIVALATAMGQAPLAIIRISGKETFPILSQIFRSKKNILESSGHEVIFGYIFDPETNQDIDQVLITIFKEPRSFTGEDMVEITCHGGMILFQKIIDLLVKKGCVLAEKGEFSKRAFMNGKMDLAQTEAIHDLIFSRSYKVSQLILGSLKKNLSKYIQETKSSLLKLVAKIEVGIDYPEDDIEPWNQADLLDLKKIVENLNELVKSSSITRTANQGYTVAIIGEPNAGKSTLLNILVGEEKAIVSSIAGTTRDPIEVFLSLNDTPVTLIDTAGLREKAENEIETMGIAKTKNIMLTSDFNILVVDSNHYILEELSKQIQQFQQERIPFLLVWNKVDLLPSFAPLDTIPLEQQISFSCKEHIGVKDLIQRLQNQLSSINTSESLFFINQRQSYILEEVLYHLTQVLSFMEQEALDLEIISLLLQKSLYSIGEIDGSDIQDSILDTIFSQFCVGK